MTGREVCHHIKSSSTNQVCYDTDKVAFIQCIIAGDDLLSPWKDYHRPRVLNGRVRDGNGCGHSGLVTGRLVSSTLPSHFVGMRAQNGVLDDNSMGI